MARAYDAPAVELKWQRRWAEEGTYEIDNDDPREKFYALCMYPYPSGPAHQGHVRNYTFGDLTVRDQVRYAREKVEERFAHSLREEVRQELETETDIGEEVRELLELLAR